LRETEPARPVEPVTIAPIGLRRDRLTIALYANFVVWGWFLYSFSPAVPLLGEEQRISKAQAGLHGTAMAVGTLLCAFISARLVERLGRRTTLLLASSALIGGVVLLISGGTLATTLPGALVTSFGGTLVLSAGTTALSVHHGEAAAAAVTEANGVGALFGLLAPLAVGASVAFGWGWRPAVALTIVLSLIAVVLIASLPARGALGSSRVPVAPLPDVAEVGAVAGAGAVGAAARTAAVGAAARTAAVGAAARLTPPAPRTAAGFSRTFWYFWVGLIAVVAIENATTFWAADLLVTRTGAGPGIATGALSGLIAGMAAARFVVGPMSLRRSPEKLLLLAFAVAAAGWLILWLATSTTLALIGLVIAGIGYGAHYPLSITLVLRSSQGRPDKAQARGTLGAGAAIGIAPFLLGALADSFGTHTAFLLVPVLIAVGALAVAKGLSTLHPREP